MTGLHAWGSACCICMCFVVIVQNFGTKFLLRRGEYKIRENSNFLKNGKIVISVKIQNFSRSWMMKQTSLLESSRQILLLRRISLNSEIVEISCFSRHRVSGAVKLLVRDM